MTICIAERFPSTEKNMRQIFKHLISTNICICVALFLSGCATSKVTQDYKPGTDFQAYKTFSWHNFSSDITPTDQLAIQHEVEQQLSQQGFQRVSVNAASASSTGVGLSIGLPIGRHGAIGLGTSKLLGNDNKFAALIILDITAQSTQQVLWRGSADDVPMDYFSLQNQAKLKGVLQNLIKQFPPK
jgi:Domain of unknown function (DUF4136)